MWIFIQQLSRRRLVAGAFALLFANAVAFAEEAERTPDKLIRWKDGLWRLETSTILGTRSGNRSRTDDLNLNLTVEYEIPAGKRGTTGVRLHPLFYYEEKSTDDSIWGAGAGVLIRIYEKAQDRRGVFGEIEGSVLIHSDKFRGNDARANFLLEAGLGYKLKSNVHATAKFRHLSNAGLVRPNSGINGVGLGIGYTF